MGVFFTVDMWSFISQEKADFSYGPMQLKIWQSIICLGLEKPSKSFFSENSVWATFALAMF